MTNFEKFGYKADEVFAKTHPDVLDKHSGYTKYGVASTLISWLNQEYKRDDILPCPFCGGKCDVFDGRVKGQKVVKCFTCWYESGHAKNEDEAIATHNKVARASVDKMKMADSVAKVLKIANGGRKYNIKESVRKFGEIAKIALAALGKVNKVRKN